MGLPARPDARQQQDLSDRWAPFRSVAARLLWHYYLKTRRSRQNQE
jgi:DNA-3-methyladenine glycosylase II